VLGDCYFSGSPHPDVGHVYESKAGFVSWHGGGEQQALVRKVPIIFRLVPHRLIPYTPRLTGYATPKGDKVSIARMVATSTEHNHRKEFVIGPVYLAKSHTLIVETEQPS
jgi:hypothetical protein